jgi:hypothetical protein
LSVINGLDGDAFGGERGSGSLPEARGGLLAFVGEDLGVGEPGAVIDRVVQEEVAARR